MSLEVVKRIAAEFTKAETKGPCGALKITKRVAQELGIGLLSKPEGNNCDGYATDIVCYPDGTIIDVLIDAGGANIPCWRPDGKVDSARYRSITPENKPTDTQYNEQEIISYAQAVREAYTKAKQPFNPLDDNAAVWVGRFQFRAVTEGYASSRSRVLKELYTVLGI